VFEQIRILFINPLNNYPQDLKETKTPQLGEFTLTFDEAMNYLKSNSKGKVTYESATNGAYVMKSIYPGFTAWADYDGVGTSKWYRFVHNIIAPCYHSNEKWAIVA
jgi:hypothetical protein